jgi:hypothetical protein
MKTTIITPSYAPDFQRCRLLCQSISQHVQGHHEHLIIIDKKDYQLFAELENNQTRLIIKEDILPGWIVKIPFSKKWWFSFKTLPVRGWILQQIVKLSAFEFSDADNFLFIDSDVTFIRSFNVNQLQQSNQYSLSSLDRKKEDYQDKRKQRWHQFAADLLELPEETPLVKDYISQLVLWKRENLIKLTQAIEQSPLNRKSASWKQFLCNTLDFSEYTLYGLFAEHRLKEKSGHIFQNDELCFCSWHQQIDNIDDLQQFLRHVPKRYPAVLIQSNLGISAINYQHLICND